MHASPDPTPDSPDADRLAFSEDDAPPPAPDPDERFWRVMVVDDDEDVHEATRFALPDLRVNGRRLQLLHARSALHARRLLASEADIAVILLDVVMETDDAGLRLVRHIREDLGLRRVRIVLRTGQPGQAPEIPTIAAFDIDDYQVKAEFTRVRLQTVLATHIRAYVQLQALEATRRGLELIVQSSASLLRIRGLARYAQGVVTQLCTILGIEPEGLICAQVEDARVDLARIVAAAGAHGPLVGRPLADVADLAVRERLAQCLREGRNLMEDGVCLYFGQGAGRAVAALVNAGRPLEATEMQLLRAFCANIAVGFENVAMYRQLVELASRDPLLLILNRERFAERIDGLQHQRVGKTLALIDIDDFAGINDAFGPRLGDEVLKAVTDRMGRTLGGRTLLARVGADTFGALGGARLVSPQGIRAVFAEPFEVAGERLQLSASAGLVRLDDGPATAAQLLLDAQIALKRAKRGERGGIEYFSAAAGNEARGRRQLIHGLRSALRNGGLSVVFQPQVNLASEAVIGAEALLRWQDADGGWVAPAKFISLAEQSGMILPIGEFVLRSACAQLGRLRELGHTGFRMGVNTSMAQLRSPGFLAMLAATLAEAGVPPQALELEITESMAMDDAEALQRLLAGVKALGVGVAIDDFGTGYSSLAQLHRLQVDRLKIDRAFVQDSSTSAVGATLAQVVVELGRALGLAVMVEGVETQPQQEWLLSLGCQEGQGWRFARPMPPAKLESWLAERGGGTPLV